jgi:hypothetical protein
VTDTIAPPRPRRRRVWRVVIGLLLLLIGAFVASDVWSRYRVRVEVARLEENYGSLDIASLQAPPVPDADNRATVARAAAGLTVRPDNIGSALSSLTIKHPSSPVSADLRAFAEANRAAVRLAADIRTRRQSNWDAGHKRIISDGSRLPLMEIRTLSDAIWVTAVLDMEAGRPDDAATAIGSGLALAASLRQEPEMISELIRIAVASRQLEGVHQLITRAAPSNAALEDLARWLAENRGPEPMTAALRGEMTMVNAAFTKMAGGRVDPGTATISPDSWPSWPRPHLGYFAQAGRPVVRLAHARYLARMREILEAQSDPRPRPAPPEPSEPARWDYVEKLARVFILGIERAVQTGHEFTSELGATEVAVALRRFELDRGHYPDDLSQLVPAYLTAIPTDPYTRKPPAYAREAGGFTLRAERASTDATHRRPREWIVK